MVGFINWDEPFHEDPYYTMMKERQDWTHKYAPGMLSFINLVPSYGPYTWGNGQWKEQVDTLVETGAAGCAVRWTIMNSASTGKMPT